MEHFGWKLSAICMAVFLSLVMYSSLAFAWFSEDYNTRINVTYTYSGTALSGVPFYVNGTNALFTDEYVIARGDVSGLVYVYYNDTDNYILVNSSDIEMIPYCVVNGSSGSSNCNLVWSGYHSVLTGETFDAPSLTGSNNIKSYVGSVVTSSVTCTFGHCFNMTSDDGFILDKGVTPSGSLSVQFWIFVNTINNNEKLACNSNDINHGWCFNYASNKVQWYIRGTAGEKSVTSTDNLPLNQWVLVTGLWDNTNQILELFFNKGIQGRLTGSGVFVSETDRDIGFGCNGGGTECIDSYSLDEVRVAGFYLGAGFVNMTYDLLTSGVAVTGIVEQNIKSVDVTIISPLNQTYSSVPNLNFMVTNLNGAGDVDECYYILNGANVSLPNCNNLTSIGIEGYNTLTVYGVATSTSTVGNSTSNFVIDSTLPIITGIQSPLNTTKYNSVNISLLYTFNETGVDDIWYNLNAGTNQTITGNTTFIAAAGFNTIILSMNDTAGNRAQEVVINFSVDSVITAPVITQPSNVTRSYFTLNYTIGDSNLDKCWYSLDDNSSTVFLASCTNLSNIGIDGFNSIQVYVNDTYGNVNMSSVNFTIRLLLLECGAISNDTALNFTFFDEDGLNLTVGEMDINIDYWQPNNQSYKANISFGFENASSFAICILPDTELRANATIVYKSFADTHSQRKYYLTNINLSKTTAQVYLYLLDDTEDYVSEIYVQDSNSVALSGYTVKIQRYYTDTNTYRTVAMVRTNDDGLGITRLRAYDYSYTWIVENNGVFIEAFPLTELVPDSSSILTKILKMSQSTVGIIYDYMGKIASSCSYNNATNVLRCLYSDTSGRVQTVNFLVQRRGALTWETICDTTQDNTAVIFTCDLSGTGTVNGTYSYALIVYLPTGRTPLISGLLEFDVENVYGNMGLFAAIILIMGIMFIGFWSAPIAILLGMIGMIATYWLKLIAISEAALIGALIVGLLVIWRIRGHDRYG